MKGNERTYRKSVLEGQRGFDRIGVGLVAQVAAEVPVLSLLVRCWSRYISRRVKWRAVGEREYKGVRKEWQPKQKQHNKHEQARTNSVGSPANAVPIQIAAVKALTLNFMILVEGFDVALLLFLAVVVGLLLL